MSIIVGQNEIINKINSLTLDTLPHSIILFGDTGSGKHLMCKYMSEKFNIGAIDMTETISIDTIETAMLRPEPYLYYMRADKMPVKSQNVILKFLEEPLNNSYIVILCNSKSQLLPTILNRCQIWELEKYNRETLQGFITTDCNKELVLDIANTPGKVISLQGIDLNNIVNTCYLILDKIGVANFSNTLTLTNKIAWKNEKDKYNFDIFVDILMYCSRNKVIQNKESIWLKLYNDTRELSNDRYIANINKKVLFENYLYKLREDYRNEN